METPLTAHSFGISEFKQNLATIVKNNKDQAFAVLSHNKPMFYCIPPNIYEDMLINLKLIEECRKHRINLLEKVEDEILNKIADMRKDQKRIPINIEDL